MYAGGYDGLPGRQVCSASHPPHYLMASDSQVIRRPCDGSGGAKKEFIHVVVAQSAARSFR